MAGIKEAFEMMDTGKRGKINLEELRVGLQKLGQQIPDPDLQILVEAVSILIFLTPICMLATVFKIRYNYTSGSDIAPLVSTQSTIILV